MGTVPGYVHFIHRQQPRGEGETECTFVRIVFTRQGIDADQCVGLPAVIAEGQPHA